MTGPWHSSQPLLTKLEQFCQKWRIGLNIDKTFCLNFYTDNKNKNYPKLWLQGELLKYKKEFKFLGITFEENLSYEAHIKKMIIKCKKRLNLLKAIRGKDWGASPNTILYTYKSYIRPILEYGCTLFAYAKDNLLKKIKAIETEAIKIAFRLPPWTLNSWCYKYVNFENILTRLKTKAKSFLDKHSKDELIQPLIDSAKASVTGQHSAVYKILEWTKS